MRSGQAARRSASQICQEVMSVWTDHCGDAKPTAEKIQKMYNEELGDDGDIDDEENDGGLNVAKHTVTVALQVKRTLLDQQPIVMIIQDADEHLH